MATDEVTIGAAAAVVAVIGLVLRGRIARHAIEHRPGLVWGTQDAERISLMIGVLCVAILAFVVVAVVASIA